MTTIPSAEELHRLMALREKASPGEWYLTRGLMADSLHITTHLREMDIGRDGAEGPICFISKERTRVLREGRGVRGFGHGEDTRFVKVPHKRADADAELIVAAINALPKLIAAISDTGRADEVAWLVEWPANRHAPTRYHSVGEPPVLDHNEATRFARKVDAENVIKREKLRDGARAIEHMWMAPRVATAAQGQAS